MLANVCKRRLIVRLLITILVTSSFILVILFMKTSFMANIQFTRWQEDPLRTMLAFEQQANQSSTITITASPETNKLGISSGSSRRDDFPLATVELHTLARLGNQMFAHASLLGIARRNDLLPSISTRDNKNRLLIDAFELKMPLLKHPPVNDNCSLYGVRMCWKSFYEHLPCAYDPNSEKIHRFVENVTTENVLLVGYLQSWRYFHQYRDEVIRELTFKTTERQIAFEYLINLREKFCSSGSTRMEPCLTIGVHVRLSDMSSSYSKSQGYSTASAEYILNAMTFMENRFNTSRLIFVISSDDLAWCRTAVNYKTRPRVTFVDQELHNNSAIRWADSAHLAILASCNHSIITVGTFSWWAAYLAGGVTVYYKNFPIPGTRIDREFRATDFYPPDWIGLT